MQQSARPICGERHRQQNAALLHRHSENVLRTGVYDRGDGDEHAILFLFKIVLRHVQRKGENLLRAEFGRDALVSGDPWLLLVSLQGLLIPAIVMRSRMAETT